MSLRYQIKALESIHKGAFAIIATGRGPHETNRLVHLNDGLLRLLGRNEPFCESPSLPKLLRNEATLSIRQRRLLLDDKPIRLVVTLDDGSPDGQPSDVELSLFHDHHESARYLVAFVRPLLSSLSLSDTATPDTALPLHSDLALQHRLADIFEALPDGIALFDKQDRLVMANSAYRDMHGSFGIHLQKGDTYEALLRRAVNADIFDFGDQSPEDMVEKLLTKRRTQKRTISVTQFRDGRWMLRHEYRLNTGENIGLRIDITEQKRREQQIAKARSDAEHARARLWNAIEALPDGFVLFDDEDKLVISNERYRQYYSGIADLMVPGVTFESLLRSSIERGLMPEATGREEEWIKTRMAEHRNPRGSVEQELPGNRHLQIHERQLKNGDTVGFRVDITELKRQKTRLEEMAADLEAARQAAVNESLQDPLTELANRRHLDLYIKKIAEEAAPDQQSALLHIDVDRFKQINDTMGHAAGDFVLKNVANTIKSLTDAFIARIGGDEFVVLIENNESRDSALQLANEISAALQEPITFQGQFCHITASIGVADAEAKNAPDLLTNADFALYQAKNAGRSRVKNFTVSMQSDMNLQRSLYEEVMKGMENNEFVSHYQPQFDTVTHDCVGAEALVRWYHPKRGVLPPITFLGIANNLRIEDQIDRSILRQSLDFCQDLERRGIYLPKMSVNVSVKRINDPALMDDLERIDDIKSTVAFELLETIFLDDDTDDNDWAIDRLRERGVEIEVDDFGSGHASIVGLLRTNPKRLKIDRRLVLPITQSRAQHKLVAAIVDMGKSLDIEITAEGVETMEHAEILTSLGCDVLQGYAFAKPMPADQFEGFLTSEPWRKSA